MTRAEEQELAKIVAEATKGDYIVGAETGKILNDGKYRDVIRTVIYHKPSKKHVVYMYRDTPGNYKKWLTDNMEKFIQTIDRQIVEEKKKHEL